MKKIDFDIDIEPYNLKFYESLSEKDQRRFAALEAMKIGYYGIKEISKKYNIHPNTIRAAKKELKAEKSLSSTKIRKKGGGRKKNSKTI